MAQDPKIETMCGIGSIALGILGGPSTYNTNWLFPEIVGSFSKGSGAPLKGLELIQGRFSAEPYKSYLFFSINLMVFLWVSLE